MDAITFECGGCQKEIRASAEAAGKRGKCAFCGHSNAVPSRPVEADEDEIPLAPIDEGDEKHMREEVGRLMDQERVLRGEDDAPDPQAVPLAQREDVKARDLYHHVVNYCLDISKSNLERGATHVDKLRQFGPTGKEAVADFLTGKALEPALDAIPTRVLQGFLTQLRNELSKSA